MQVNRLPLICLLMLILLSNCNYKILQPDEFINWVEDRDNGLIKSEALGDAVYTVFYHPPQYIKARALMENDSFVLRNSNDFTHSFVVKMEPKDGKTQFLTLGAKEKSEPFERIGYYMESIKEDINLLVGSDTIQIDNLIYERYYNVSPSQKLIIGFRSVGDYREKGIKLIINDRAINTDKMVFDFDSKVIKSIPKI